MSQDQLLGGWLDIQITVDFFSVRHFPQILTFKSSALQNLGFFSLIPSKRPGGIYPRVLFKWMPDIIMRHLTMIAGQPWKSREVLTDWNLANIVRVFKKGKRKNPGDYKSASLTSVPDKIMKKIILGVIAKQLKDNKVIGHSQQGSVRGMSCLSNQTSFYDTPSWSRGVSWCKLFGFQ